MGSRYGGLKQVEAVGPRGATLMDYSIFDALRAGFGRLVFVIRPDMEEAFRERIGSRYQRHVAVEYAYQRLDDLPGGRRPPAGREKPWGTAHALLSASFVNTPLAVLNADDFYGAPALRALGSFLSSDAPAAGPAIHAMVAYALRDTLSETGTVSRGVCRTTPDGWLESIVETLGIEPDEDGARAVDESGTSRRLAADTLVSMNCWGFRPSIFEELRRTFTEFLAQHGDSLRAECSLPAVVQQAIAGGRARVRVLEAGSAWCGITNPGDKPRVQSFIRQLVESGQYPEDLWG
jgi:hypothetical protein